MWQRLTPVFCADAMCLPARTACRRLAARAAPPVTRWVSSGAGSSARTGGAQFLAPASAAAATLGACAAIAWESDAVRCEADAKHPGLLESERSTINLFNRSCPSVASVIILGDPRLRHYSLRGGQESRAAGSGFVWDMEGHVVTNFHVVQGARGSQLGVQLMGRRQPYPARVVGTDPQNDIAVLRIEASPRDLTPLPLGSSRELQVGQNAIAIGNPFGLEYTLTTGVISGIGREITGTLSTQKHS